jgi:outer membrane immunogenic protein
MISMKKMLCTCGALVLTAAVAHAADLPRKMPIKAAPAPVYDWTGLYLGGFYGTSIGQSKMTGSVSPGAVDVNDTGITAGATLGYNWQFSPSGLVGIEADIGWLGTKRIFEDFDNPVTVGVKSTGYGTIRGRIGYVTGPSLLYLTVGGAAVRLEETSGLTGSPTVNKTTDWGWTIGGGIETKLSRSWTAKTEYLYVDLGSNSFNAPSVTQDAVFDNQFHVIKTGLNYKFGQTFELPVMLPPLSSPQRWAGLYAGVNAGGGLSYVHTPWNSAEAGEVDVNGGGVAGGGHVGYNMVLFSNWIAGVEADLGYLGIDHSVTDLENVTPVGNDLYRPGVKTNWYGTIRGRVGSSTGPALLYVTGGAAFVNVENSLADGTGTTTIKGTRTGWAFGGGIETELGPLWSARLESLYMDVGSDKLSSPLGTVEFKNRFQVIRAGLSYKFGGPDVVTARY